MAKPMNTLKVYKLIIILFIAMFSGCGFDVPGYGVHVECDKNNNCEPVTKVPGTPKAVVSYIIWVRTGTMKNADTDGDVSITLFGTKGQSKRLELDTSADDFEKGAYDWYGFTLPNLGELHTVCVEHENSGEKQGWFLVEILVESDEDNSWYFPFKQWLADDDKTGNRWTCRSR
jgi:hypothetical protein